MAKPNEESKSSPVAGSAAHEKAVKKVISNQLQTLGLLEKLNVIEARNLEIGNSFMAFRFSDSGIRSTAATKKKAPAKGR